MADLITRLRTSASPESPLGKLMSEAADVLEAAQAEQGEPVAWMYTEHRGASGAKKQRVSVTIRRQGISEEDRNEFEISEQPLYARALAKEQTNG